MRDQFLSYLLASIIVYGGHDFIINCFLSLYSRCPIKKLLLPTCIFVLSSQNFLRIGSFLKPLFFYGYNWHIFCNVYRFLNENLLNFGLFDINDQIFISLQLINSPLFYLFIFTPFQVQINNTQIQTGGKQF